MRACSYAVALAALAFSPTALAKPPPGAQSPTIDWIIGAWVYKGGTCGGEGGPEVYLPDGRGAMVLPEGLKVISTYSLRGDRLTSTVPTEKYGDLVDTVRVARLGPNDWYQDYPSGAQSLPRKRCPIGPGVEPWFPKQKFKGIDVLKMPIIPQAGAASKQGTRENITEQSGKSAAAPVSEPLSNLLVGHWESTLIGVEEDPGRCVSTADAYDHTIQVFHRSGKYEHLHEEGDDVGRWRVVGDQVEKGSPGSNGLWQVQRIGRDHIILRADDPNVTPERLRRCHWKPRS